jgi:hypothetical protein
LADAFERSIDSARASMVSLGLYLGYRMSPEAHVKLEAALAAALAAIRDDELTVCLRNAPPGIARAQHELARADGAFQDALERLVGDGGST